MSTPRTLLAAALVALVLAAPLHAQAPERNIRFGMPGPAAADPARREAFLIARPQYVLSYNAEKRIPNWVCWQLQKSDIGKVPRAAFTPDPDLPHGFARVASHIYDGSGFDRGHMCPAKDRSATLEDMAAVFYMTNIVPQSSACNQRGWERLEDYCRTLAHEGHVLSIACGPAGVGGEGKNGRADEISKDHLSVTVPAKLWKVILVLPQDDAEPRRNSRVIAVIMPNDESVGYDWTRYRVTTHRVEQLTGYHFFHNLPRDVATALRNHLDKVEVHVHVPHHEGGRGKRGGD